MKKGILFVFAFILFGLLVISLTSLVSAGWWNDDWNRKKQITIQGGDTVLNNFAVFLKVNYDSDMISDYGDLRFLDSSEAVELKYDIDYYTASEAGIWIRTPQLNPGNNIIYMYYGNPSATSTESPQETFFNQISNNQYVLHLQNSQVVENEINSMDNWNLVGTIPLTNVCKFGKCYDSTYALNNYIQHSEFTTSAEGTLSFWVKKREGWLSAAKVGGRGTTGLTTKWLIYLNSTYSYLNTDDSIVENFTANVGNEWVYVTLTWDSSNIYLYINSQLSNTRNTGAPNSGGTGGDFLFRSYQTGTGENTQNLTIDEVKFEKRKWIDAEIKRDYENADFNKFSFGNEQSKETWWDNSWTRKKQITIQENSNQNLVNYSVRLTVNYDSDMQSDFDDLRFVDSSETQELNYWIEEKSDNSYAIVWLKIPNLAASLSNSIYMYYGNPSASSKSNIAQAFLFADDFSGTSIDTNKWGVYQIGGSIVVGGGVLNMSGSGSSQRQFILSHQTFSTENFAIDWHSNYNTIGEQFFTGFWNWTSLSSDPLGISIWNNIMFSSYGAIHSAEESYFSSNNATDSYGITLGSNTIYNGWNNLSITVPRFDNKTIYKNNIANGTLTQGAYNENNVKFKAVFGGNPNAIIQLDWIRVRTYTSPEPTSTFGEEQPRQPIEKEYYTKEEIDEILRNYYNKEQVDEKIEILQATLNLIQNTLDNFINKIITYLTYLPSGFRKMMICGYMKENQLSEYEDIGVKCKIISGTCFCSTTLIAPESWPSPEPTLPPEEV